MTTNPFLTSYHFRRSASFFLVVVSHVLILALFMHPGRLQNTVPAHALMSIFSVAQDAGEKPKISNEQAAAKIARHFEKPKDRVIKTSADESKNLIEEIYSGQPSTEKTKEEGNPISGKELAALDSLARRYKLDLPKVPLAETLTPAQQAAQDPRTNSPRLTKSEKFAVALGSLDCIFQTRLADGKIIRVPGQWVVGSARTEPGMKTLAKSRFCVRFHQEADEDGNDLTAISAGIKGKL